MERLAIERSKQLFGAEHANVQPHAGVQANMAVYFTVLQPGDTILGMNLSHGGHLSHGSPASFSGTFYRGVFYGVDRKTETIDFNEVEILAKKHRPKIIVVGASAYPRIIDYEKFRVIADEVGALILADIAHIGGLVAAALHPSPVPCCEFVTMTTHKTLRGPRGGLIMCKQKFAKALDEKIFPGMQGGPLMHIIAAKAVAFKEALTDDFRRYQAQILKNARTLADELLADGFRLVSGGTDNHLMLVDLTDLGITGMEAQETLDRTGITINKNRIPYDTKGAPGDKRHPHRHARPDHAGDEGAGDETDRRSLLRRAPGYAQRKAPGRGPGRGPLPLRAIPHLPGADPGKPVTQGPI